MRILVVEDDSEMAGLLRRGLTAEGHRVEIAGDGNAGYDKAKGQEFDAIILDVMLPETDGFALTRRLRRQGNRVPILMLTGKDSPKDIVHGLDLGADDYLTKPFSFEVLSARLRLITRRNREEGTGILQVADLTLNPQTHEVHRAGRPVVLTRTEFMLLDCLMSRAGRVVSRDALIELVWGVDRDVESNTIEVFIWQLRTKIEVQDASRLIHTVRGFGYSLREMDRE